MANPTISRVRLPNGGGIYDIKDQVARDSIATIAGGTFFLGVTTSNIYNGSTLNPITVKGKSVTAINGNMVIKGLQEFIWYCTSYTYYAKLEVSGSPGEFYYQDITNSATEAQKADAAFVPPSVTIPTSAEDPTTEPLVGGADYIKAERTGEWVEFGDLSTLGELAYLDPSDLGAEVYSSSAQFMTNATVNVSDVTGSVVWSEKDLKSPIVSLGTGSVAGVNADTQVVTGVTLSENASTDVDPPTGGVRVVTGATASMSPGVTVNFSHGVGAMVTIPENMVARKLCTAKVRDYSFGVTNGVLTISYGNGTDTNGVTVATGQIDENGSGGDIITSSENAITYIDVPTEANVPTLSNNTINLTVETSDITASTNKTSVVSSVPSRNVSFTNHQTASVIGSNATMSLGEDFDGDFIVTSDKQSALTGVSVTIVGPNPGEE